MPRVLRWFIRWVYDYYGFGVTGKGEYCSFEDLGGFDNEADARWAANCRGGSVKTIPYNASLPQETVMFGQHDFPQSEASSYYRNRRLPYTAVPTDYLERLEAVVNRTQEPVH